MNNDQEKAVEKFTFALLEVLDRQPNADIDFKRQAFEEACLKATKVLSKEEMTKILMFVIFEHDIFFDIFEQAVSQHDTASKNV